jgi:acetolactate synthase-1/2/3 large subunit
MDSGLRRKDESKCGSIGEFLLSFPNERNRANVIAAPHAAGGTAPSIASAATIGEWTLQTVGQLIVAMLEANGVDRVFCLPGESFLPVLDALRDSAIDTVTCRHESAAGFMALADARLTGRPGICLVSRGPGATNAAIAAHTAQQDGLPLLLFVGQVARRQLRRDGFQEIDYGKMYGEIAKLVADISDPERTIETMSRAMNTAVSGTPGPVVIALPEDILDQPVAVPELRPLSRAVTGPNEDAVAEVARLLAAARHPLIIAGGELAAGEGRRLLREAAERLALPVAVSFRRHDLFAHDHPHYAGDLGFYNSRAQVDAFAEADLVLALGTRLGDLTTKGYSFPQSPFPRQKLVHVYGDSAIVGRHYRPDIGLVCDAPSFLAKLLATAPAAPPPPERARWIERLHALHGEIAAWRPKTAPDGVVFGNVIAALARAVDDDVLVVPDAGISAALLYRYFPLRPKQRLLATIAGVMGFGVPGAVAVALRERGRQIVCIVGDGGFLMTGSELALAVERKLPIRIFLANNRSLGTIRFNQERDYPGRAWATDLSGPDFADLARSFGCAALVLDREAAVASTIADALRAPGPILVEVKASLSAILPEGGAR